MGHDHPFGQRWNHNTHYYPRVDELIGPTARVILDIGCGDGALVEFLRRPGRLVIGLDPDLAVLPSVGPAGDAAYLAASGGSLPIATASVDAVTMVMSLHHLEPVAALSEVRRVLRTGGLLVLVGYGSASGPLDRLAELRDLAAHRWHRRGKQAWEPATAKCEPTLTWRQNRDLVARELPGAGYRRLPMWRYLVTWRR